MHMNSRQHPPLRAARLSDRLCCARWGGGQTRLLPVPLAAGVVPAEGHDGRQGAGRGRPDRCARREQVELAPKDVPQHGRLLSVQACGRGARLGAAPWPAWRPAQRRREAAGS